MYLLRRDKCLKEQSKHTCQGTRTDYEVDQMGHFRLQSFREYLLFC